MKNNPKASLNLITETYKYPSVNIIGKIEGTDPVLKNEYVLLSGHQDHDGIRHPVKNDTIYNGADDNASTCVAMLAMARAYIKNSREREASFLFSMVLKREDYWAPDGTLPTLWFPKKKL